MLYTIWLYAIRRKTECNRFRKKMYVIHRGWNVINPRERNIQVLRLDDIPFALQTDYIRLTAITYQSFGLDKNKALVSASALFFGVPEGIRTPDLLVRSQLLYPAELQTQIQHDTVYSVSTFLSSVFCVLRQMLCFSCFTYTKAYRT